MRINKGSLSDLILNSLEKSVDGFVRFEDFAYNSHLYTYGRWQQNLPKTAISRAISRLRKKGIIEELNIDEKLVFKLTQTGIIFQSENYFDDTKWDSKWRIVIFDIPEQKRAIRNLFRRNLKKWGFTPLQKSVWISKKNIYQKLVKYIEDLKLEKWVIVLETDKIDSLPKHDAIV